MNVTCDCCGKTIPIGVRFYSHTVALEYFENDQTNDSTLVDYDDGGTCEVYKIYCVACQMFLWKYALRNTHLYVKRN